MGRRRGTAIGQISGRPGLQGDGVTLQLRTEQKTEKGRDRELGEMHEGDEEVQTPNHKISQSQRSKYSVGNRVNNILMSLYADSW